ncbi:MAG TPA: hypothetical protein VKA85_10055 [Candidatus Limnocylindrales bacterium]|nr:hypothetical protein [Candidatus Limnocylindrales bacterium]
MSDFPLALPGALGLELARVLDVEGKIPRALIDLGGLTDRDVALVAPDGGLRQRQLGDAGARIVGVDALVPPTTLEPGSMDAVVACWSGFRGVDAAEVAEADRVLRPGGRLLVVHDYGRDDVSRLRGDLPEYGLWSRRDGPFLRGGFRVRVIHCWWTFESIDAATEFLGDAFGDAGREVASGMRRPRLSYNVAIYHRLRDGAAPG